MPGELHRDHPPVEGPAAGAQAADPLGGDSVGCGTEHGLRAGAGTGGDDSRDTRPDRATRFVETTLGVLSYSELAPLLAERVTRLEAAVLAEEFAARRLDESLLTDFHSRLCGDLTPEWAGKWRTAEITVGQLTPPSPHQVPILMRDYVLDLQARWDGASADDIELTLEFLAFAEGRFLSIHPFRDFNGRTIRVFLTELLRRLDLPRVELAPESDADRTQYLAALESCRPPGLATTHRHLEGPFRLRILIPLCTFNSKAAAMTSTATTSRLISASCRDVFYPNPATFVSPATRDFPPIASRN